VEFDLYWQAVRWLALEHLHLQVDESAVVAESLIVGSFDGAPLRLRYRLVADADWNTTALSVSNLMMDERVDLQRSADMGWRDANGSERSELAAARDVDIAATPFTNTLPIRRLGLSPGESKEITVVYVGVAPGLSLRPVQQRYTRLQADAGGDRYLYESLESDFKRELIVDTHGLVVDYPGIWQRASTNR
jgi:uncharacterized protein